MLDTILHIIMCSSLCIFIHIFFHKKHDNHKIDYDLLAKKILKEQNKQKLNQNIDLNHTREVSSGKYKFSEKTRNGSWMCRWLHK